MYVHALRIVSVDKILHFINTLIIIVIIILTLSYLAAWLTDKVERGALT